MISELTRARCIGTPSDMEKAFIGLCILLSAHHIFSEESGDTKSWSWNNEGEQFKLEDAIASETIEQPLFNATDIEDVVDAILVSSRQGRNLKEYGEVYTDPNLQEALQKGDDNEARNLIRDKLCSLGLMQCEEYVQGKRPYIAPEDLVYAQPVSINPVGRPIPSIPVKGPPRGAYGPPKPIPFPPGPPNKYGPPHKYGPPPPLRPHGPPRRGYGPPPPPSKPYFDKNYISSSSSSSGFLSSSFDSTSEFISSKPPFASEFPYEIDANPAIFHKDKKPVEIVINGGGATGNAGGVQQHVHHHFHHGNNVNKIPVAGVVPLVSETVGASLVENQNIGFKPSQLISSGVESSFSSGSGFSSSSANFGISNINTVPSLTLGGSSLSGNYGGQSIANYGGLGSFASNKPSLANYGPQTFGSSSSSASSLYNGDTVGASVGYYGNSEFYKKELDVGSLQSNSLLSGDKYQSLGSSKYENYDCVCVPYDQCPSHEIIGRKDDLILALDPRNLKSDIEAEDVRIVTDGNGNMSTIRIPKNAVLNVTANENQDTSSRTKREVTEDKKSPSDSQAEGRQSYFGGGFGRPPACGPRHVCCRRPLRPNIPVPSTNRQCGVRNTQGINGRIKNPVYVDGDSEFGEYPWQVAILKKDPKESVYVCGGTVIDPLHIVTAAHCVKTYTPHDLRLRLGEWDVNHDVEFYPYIERDVSNVMVHPEFYAGTLYNDVAILRMDKPVDFSRHPHISPACLPSLYDDFTGARCWTTGWGKDAFGEFGKYQNILKEVDVPVVGHAQCQRQLQQTRLGYEFKLHPGFICAGGEEGKDACKGDGGGPMVCERAGSWKLVGVVSWGIGCGQVGVPGVLTYNYPKKRTSYNVHNRRKDYNGSSLSLRQVPDSFYATYSNRPSLNATTISRIERKIQVSPTKKDLVADDDVRRSTFAAVDTRANQIYTFSIEPERRN
ncbi:CLIPA10 [Trypoxylus dichotomus]